MKKAHQMTKKIKAVIFDWAGTMIDYGSLAPTVVFTELFQSQGLTVTNEEAREPMGLSKREHIAAMLAMPRIAVAFEEQFNRPANTDDVDRLYEIFIPLNEAVAAQYATLIPGALDAVKYLRNNDIKIGSTTGYSRSVMNKILPLASAAGYNPDNIVCGDDLSEGRPAPLMMYRCFADLGVYPPETVIKVDDTTPGIAEGKAVGCITVGISLSGNYVGLNEQNLSALPDDKRAQLNDGAANKLLDAGADHVIDSVSALPDLIESLKVIS
jgi:phosphonoacetaldehyde hydrolase|tara:strand:+ start:460 stop:1266 length:807 start_codon:yes stop_codon:yes gene_type:complete